MNRIREVIQSDVFGAVVFCAFAASFPIAGLSGCAPVAPKTATPQPIQATPSEVFNIADGGRFSIETTGGEVAFNGASLVLPKSLAGTMAKDGNSLTVTFSRPLPRGKATRFGMSLSAGIESVKIEPERITAFTDVLGKRFVWELRETP
jgi:hypothetical protein